MDRSAGLSDDCQAAIDFINQQALEKKKQAQQARGRNPEALKELMELYPSARNAWNRKVQWIQKNGPGYSTGFGPRGEDGSEFTTTDEPKEVHRFFSLLHSAAHPSTGLGRGRDIVADVATEEQGKFMPRVFEMLLRLKNQCRKEQKLVLRELRPIQLPVLFDDL